MTALDNYTRDVLARFRDFVGPGVQWQRGLWDVGLVVALRELHEASSAVQAGALSKSAVKWLALSISAQLTKDPGAGDGTQAQRIRRLLNEDLTAGGVNHSELALWSEDIEAHYLQRWQAATKGPEIPSREQLARALATHLIGQQLSPEFLRDWAKGLEKTTVDAPGLLGEARTLASSCPETFEVMIAFERPPHRRFARPPEWRDARSVSTWLAAAGFSTIRQHGGLLLSLTARDPYSAALESGEVIDRLEARAAVGTRDALVIRRESFVLGHGQPLAQRVSRRAEVRALEREDALLRLDPGGPVDQSLELLSHLNTSPDAVAAAAGWSSVESLLSGPGDDDKVVTADRLANLVACSWPRAELTTIAWARLYQADQAVDRLAAELNSCETNRQRADRVLRAVVDEEISRCLGRRSNSHYGGWSGLCDRQESNSWQCSNERQNRFAGCTASAIWLCTADRPPASA